ncbi:MAG: hypothetical protein ACLUVI_09590 [Acutalibacteraceae bacterium]
MLASSLLAAYGFDAERCYAVLAVKDAERIMVDFGYPQNLLHTMKDAQKLELASKIKTCPESVSLQTVVSPIDELSMMELLVNATDEQLRCIGFREEDIMMNRQIITSMRALTNEELAEYYGKNDEEIKLLRMAMEQQSDYQSPEQVKQEDQVTTSTISTSTLKYAWVIYDNRAETKKPVSYFVHIGFQWNGHPSVTFLKDKIGISWGCDMDSMAETCEVVLTGINGSSIRKGEMEVVPNKGLIFTFWQRAVHGLGFDLISSGYAACTVFQNSRRDLSARIESKYGHGVFTVTGGGVSIGVGEGGVGIDFGFGFRESIQLQDALNV